MDISGIAAGASGLGSNGAATSEELGKDAFMKLLVSQLQNQDPINPQSNEDFIAQLAQFSSLEQMENLNDSFIGQAVLNQSNALMSQLTAGSTLIGQEVVYSDPVSGESQAGVVDTVRIQDGIAVLNVDGVDVPLLNVLEITGPPEDPGTGDEGSEGSGEN